MRKANAFYVDVYRSAALGDCTNDGVSSRHDTLIVLCTRTNTDADTRVSVNLDDPPDNLAKLVASPLGGVHIEPYAATGSGYMFGGNYAATSDAPLSRALRAFDATSPCFQYAIPIHDRTE